MLPAWPVNEVINVDFVVSDFFSSDQTMRQTQNDQSWPIAQPADAVPCQVPVEYKQASKHVRLCTVAVNETCTNDLKIIILALVKSTVEHVVWEFLHAKYDSSVSCIQME